MELENVHLATLLVTVLVILYADHQGFDYVRGKRQTLQRTAVTWSHRLVSLGLLLMVGTGVGLVLPAYEHWLANPTFYIKIGFVVTLVINGFFIGKLSRIATETPFASLDRNTRTTLMLSGTLSAVGWIGAAVTGFFFL